MRIGRALLAVGGCACAVWVIALSPATPQQAPRRPTFTDVASRSKFPYVTHNSFPGRKYFPQPMCGGVAVFDFDNDGRMDIFFTNGASLPELKKTDPSYYNCLLHQRADGTFEDVTANAGLAGENLDFNFGVAVGDYDNDGYEDLFLCGAQRNTLYHNNGDGTFTDVTAASGIGAKPPNTLSVAAAWFDYDNDGLLDLIVSDYTVWTPATDHRCQMDDRDYYCNPQRYPSVPPRLYHNLGHGKFEDVTRRSGLAVSPGKGMGVAIADFNGDGWPDVFIANDTEPNSLFLNRRNGTFEEKGLELGVAYNDNGHVGSSMGCDARDFNNDGTIDVFYNNLMGQIWGLLRNRGDLFEIDSYTTRIQKLSAPYSGWSTGFIDYDNDGWKDIYSANGDVDMVSEKSRAARHHVREPRRQDLRRRFGADGEGLPAQGLPARLGLRRPEQRWVRGHRGHVFERAAPDPPQQRWNREPLADSATGGAHQRARCHWGEGEADGGVRARALQPRRH